MAPLFLLTPASLAWAFPFAAYSTWLSTRVSLLRIEALKQSKRNGSSSSTSEEDLKTAIRSHGNFIENVPFSFVLLTLAELNGARTSLIQTAYAALFAVRIAHVLGLQAANRQGVGRQVGAIGTHIINMSAAFYNLSLSWDFILTGLGIRR